MKPIVCSVAVLFALYIQPVHADPSLALLQARGEGRLTVAADQAELTLTIETSALDAESVVADNSVRTNKVRQALRDAGMAEEAITTRGFSVQPQWAPRPQGAPADWRPRISGYRARHQLYLEVQDLEALPRWIEVAVAAGADQVGQLRYGLADPDAHYQRALEQATRQAHRQAQTVAAAAGVGLGALHWLEVEGATPAPRPAMRMEAMALRADARPPLEPAEVEVRAVVLVRYRIQP